MRADGSEAHMLTHAPDEIQHENLNWSPDGKSLLYDIYKPSLSLESDIQMIEVESGKITDLGINGYNAKWVQH